MTMDIALIIAGSICVITGVIGCIIPVLPGPIMCYAGLLLLQLTSGHPFTPSLLVIYAILTALAALLDYIIPVYGTKKFRGSKYGIWGSAVGLILGIMFFFPLGIVLGPIAGAFAGELLSGRSADRAIKSAFGSFLGFLASTIIRLVLSLAMAYHFALAAYDIFAV